MLIYQNAEGVNGQTKFGNNWFGVIHHLTRTICLSKHIVLVT